MSSKNFSIMSYTDVMDKSFNIHKKHMGTSALYLLIFYIISFILSLVLILIGVFSFGFLAFNSLNDFQEDLLTRNMGIGSIITFTSIFVIIFLFMYLFKAIKEVGIIDIASRGILDKKVRLENAIGQAFKNIPVVLSVLLAYSIILIPFMPIVGGLGYLTFRLDLIENFDQFSVWMIVLGLGILCIYGYLTTIYMFTIQAAVVEKLYFFKALRRSRMLVKGCFWRLLGVNILFSITVLAITYSIYSILGILGGLLYIVIKSFSSDESTMTILMMIGNLLRLPLQVLFSLFISPLTGIFLTTLYYNQRFKKEGYNIQLKLEKLEETEKTIKEKNSEKFITSTDDSKQRNIR
ncbi:glycerophosphoryl diester phosphodiesterase membrane domain-containing protein [Wukongibacter sp. M2B1]|uniref:glycerophosphoryl diester phosphodiesterase membrane domain-containing protein n=1 Tax=Wukongibacter sp. M2B1 TaxID=3088895 RepID=UPI003D7AB668